jgi:hypothetical protein
MRDLLVSAAKRPHQMTSDPLRTPTVGAVGHDVDDVGGGGGGGGGVRSEHAVTPNDDGTSTGGLLMTQWPARPASASAAAVAAGGGGAFGGGASSASASASASAGGGAPVAASRLMLSERERQARIAAGSGGVVRRLGSPTTPQQPRVPQQSPAVGGVRQPVTSLASPGVLVAPQRATPSGPRRIPGPVGELPPLAPGAPLPSDPAPPPAVPPSPALRPSQLAAGGGDAAGGGGMPRGAPGAATAATALAAGTHAGGPSGARSRYFTSAPWLSLLLAVGAPPPPSAPFKFNVEYVHKHGFGRKVCGVCARARPRCRRAVACAVQVPFLAVAVTDLNVGHSDALAVLCDPSGRIDATMHRRVLDTFPQVRTRAHAQARERRGSRRRRARERTDRAGRRAAPAQGVRLHADAANASPQRDRRECAARVFRANTDAARGRVRPAGQATAAGRRVRALRRRGADRGRRGHAARPRGGARRPCAAAAAADTAAGAQRVRRCSAGDSRCVACRRCRARARDADVYAGAAACRCRAARRGRRASAREWRRALAALAIPVALADVVAGQQQCRGGRAARQPRRTSVGACARCWGRLWVGSADAWTGARDTGPGARARRRGACGHCGAAFRVGHACSRSGRWRCLRRCFGCWRGSAAVRRVALSVVRARGCLGARARTRACAAGATYASRCAVRRGTVRVAACASDAGSAPEATTTGAGACRCDRLAGRPGHLGGRAGCDRDDGVERGRRLECDAPRHHARRERDGLARGHVHANCVVAADLVRGCSHDSAACRACTGDADAAAAADAATAGARVVHAGARAVVGGAARRRGDVGAAATQRLVARQRQLAVDAAGYSRGAADRSAASPVARQAAANSACGRRRGCAFCGHRRERAVRCVMQYRASGRERITWPRAPRARARARAQSTGRCARWRTSSRAAGARRRAARRPAAPSCARRARRR